ncbi:pyridoxal-phosphate-dependent aminotransferase family protein [Mycoplasma crocodyli]|uniref:Putative aminotransferase n=1 Tax=Mycoplasma crocodyli (strain ATCC 51981 / MP145) TaxID=512564 RepID=D5E5G9_MYCCM|nr:aminotransferase class V-fold PLP-dependent enzyme [Mycoplasma crocodyli]ADE19528.1 putative aminotransferase [Mycoplasma crocodyli MP145]
MSETVEMLKDLFQTKTALPMIMTCSATGLLEATIVNLLEKNDKVLSIVNGDFSNRFKIMAQQMGCNVDTLEYQDGTTFNIRDVNKALKNNEYKALIVTWHETSTGVLNDIHALSKSLKKFAPNTLFIVDSVSAIINHDLNFDKNNIDIAFATSGKGFSVMPGLSVLCASHRAIEESKRNKNYKFYFDFSKYESYYNDFKSTPFTPASSILMAMHASLVIMKNETIEEIRRKKEVIYNYLDKEFSKMGFENKIEYQNRTLGLLVVDAPEGIETIKLRNTLDYKHNIYMELGRLSKRNSQLRIGISNTITLDDAKNLVMETKNYLNELKKNKKKEE